MTQKAYRPAQYLLRFDDLCPTQSRAGWEPFARLIAEFALKPILAVVPDNRDPELAMDPPDAGFWEQMRRFEAGGAAIALHGYQHVCKSRGRGLIPLHRETEFAGVTAATQRAWIAAGLGILRGHGLNPRLWVAPRHGFDGATLVSLRSEGIQAISDGFARRPFVRRGLVWLPQQLWAPVEKRSGLWTICLHSNTASEEAVAELRAFLGRQAGSFTSVDRVLCEAEPRGLGVAELAYALTEPGRIRLRRLRDSLTGNRAKHQSDTART